MDTSTEIINKAKERFEGLKHKGFDWKSFYNGFLEGYTITKELYGVYNQDDKLLTVHITEMGAEEERKTHGYPFGKYFYVDKVTINL
jgi:hypothetical protein